MPNDIINIPIEQVASAGTAVLLIYLTMKTAKTAKTEAFEAFAWSLFFAALTFGARALPGVLVYDPLLIQFSQSVDHLFYGIVVAFAFRMIMLLKVPRISFLTLVMPVLIAISTVSLFIWHVTVSPPAEMLVLSSVPQYESFQLISFPDTGPVWAITILGLMGSLTFFTGGLLFYLGIDKSRPLLGKRQFRIGLALALAGLTIFFQYVINNVLFESLAGATALASVGMLYWATRVKFSPDQQQY